jgi:hypothetical protein
VKTISGIAFIACCAIVTAPAFADASQARATVQHRPLVREAYNCSAHRNAGGTLVTCDGWRLRSTARGWDNSCFNLNYLPSKFACSAR